jgi:hypothetical protein
VAGTDPDAGATMTYSLTDAVVGTVAGVDTDAVPTQMKVFPPE